jgi:hypothetical protein
MIEKLAVAVDAGAFAAAERILVGTAMWTPVHEHVNGGAA